MIASLRIQKLATIEDAEIRFGPGFSILTGETGAGKSIIIDGLKLILGEKASPELIRTGEKEAAVEAVFRLPGGQKPSGDAPFSEDGELLIQRRLAGDGTGKAYVNGVLVPVKRLREIGQSLVDIYGQNDHVFLLQTENHRKYLDEFAGLVPLGDEVAALSQALRSLVREKGQLEMRRREREQRLDFLSFQVREIESAGLRPGEWEDLSAERHLLKNAEKISGLVDKALDLAYAAEGSAAAVLAALRDRVRELGRYDQSLGAFEGPVGEAAITARELGDLLIRFKERQGLGPERLEEVEARLNTIEKLKRKYGETTEAVLAHLVKVKEEHQDLLQSQEKLADIEGRIARGLEDYRARAGRLSRLRSEDARKLASRVEKEISTLAMKKARFQVRLETQPPDALDPASVRDSGLDGVEFLISPNPGEELRPLRKIASGGELSRIMLALKTVGKEKAGLKTLIFDEIDSGIGGKTAECIAEKLRDLSGAHQVICITHLPQIASFASDHYRIDKSVERDRTYTTVEPLDFEARVEEISRLLSGSRITPTAVENAREMLHHNLKPPQRKDKRQ
ncbi:MAG: DNA repair protein RecN [Candidatus Aminicenantes bacterium RBG_16_63_16]|nr:MAG: DNA repair protein RecN [Candidatus Aminicenantes bacterium RBG_16_63_16]